MRIEREDLLRVGESMGRHWLDTDGHGGCASSSVLLCPSLRSHGLLTAPLPGSGRRWLFLSRFDEWISGGGREFPLSLAQYPGTLHPGGHQFIDSFESAPGPRFLYRIGDLEVLREVAATAPPHAVLVRWSVSGPGRARSAATPLLLSLRPHLPCRDADGLARAAGAPVPRVERVPGGIVVRRGTEFPSVHVTLGSADAEFEADGAWYRDIEYPGDAAEGREFREDVFSPGVFRVPVGPSGVVVAAASLGEAVDDPEAAWEAARAPGGTPRRGPRRGRARAGADGDGVPAALAGAAGRFPFRAPGRRHAVAAAWPGGPDRPRDACIALPGLSLAGTGRDTLGAALVDALPRPRSRREAPVEGGLPDAWDASDAALWWIRAVRLREEGGRPDAAGSRRGDGLDRAVLDLVARIADGGHAALRPDGGSLLACAPGSTWMDAPEWGDAAVRRAACPVEVNGLWCLALDQAARAAGRSARRRERRRWTALRRAAAETFRARFVLADGTGVADGWEDGRLDATVRPNGVIAASLPASPLPRAVRAAVVRRARGDLLTPRGLRSLSPRESGYRGRCDGDAAACRAGMLRGGSWPWLLGCWVDASLRAEGRGRRARVRLRALLDALAPHLGEHGMGHVSEAFDGDPPRRPRGAMAHAAATGEILRAYALLEAAGA